MGDRYNYLMQAITLLDHHSKIKMVNISSIYETDPVGYEEQDLFLNMVVVVKTDLNAEKLLETCLQIELKLGRKREIRWGPRTMDLDILLFNQENIQTDKLTIPHPRMFERAFVTVPLFEIIQDSHFPEIEKALVSCLDHNREGVRIWKRKNGEGEFEPFES